MEDDIKEKFEELTAYAKKLGKKPDEILQFAKEHLKREEAEKPFPGEGPEKKVMNDEETKKQNEERVWEKVQLARHPDRPTSLDYITMISEQYMELHGDRYYGDDKALIGGLCTIEGINFTFLAHQKGANLKENIERHYGMAHPEGYRKALRLAKQAEAHQRPIITFIDTPGAYPGMDSEERGIGEAIAKNLMEFSTLHTPIICIIIGEGGSGGALGIGVGDRVFMLENAIYSVISPEGFASILLRNAKRAKEAAVSMRLTAEEVFNFNLVDGIIVEPIDGAHADPVLMGSNIKQSILESYAQLQNKDYQTLVAQRSQKIINYTRDLELDASGKDLFSRIKEYFF